MNKNSRRSFFAAVGVADRPAPWAAAASRRRGAAAALVIQAARAARAHRAAATEPLAPTPTSTPTSLDHLFGTRHHPSR